MHLSLLRDVLSTLHVGSMWAAVKPIANGNPAATAICGASRWRRRTSRMVATETTAARFPATNSAVVTALAPRRM